MKFRFSGKRISALVTALPPRESKFEDEIGNYGFTAAKSMKLKLIMGFDRHRVVDEGTCASDLCCYALEHILAAGELQRDDVGAVLFVSQSPDHLIPPTSNLIQARAAFGRDTFCMDINQGCAGFVVGLVQSFLLLEAGIARKVVLLNGDTLSRRIGKRDRNIYPMIGDAGSAAVIENDPGGPPVHGVLYMDGSRAKALIIPAGGSRMPSTAATAVETEVGDGNFRSRDHFYMDGPAVFNFIQTEVPPMIEELLAYAGSRPSDVDGFIFHQPNKFMLEKLADAMGVSQAKVPNNIVENFGNASSVTVPTNIAFNFGATLKDRRLRMCLGGFGVGLTWGAVLMGLGPMRLCELINYSEGTDRGETSSRAGTDS